jgi:hypothetical protein
MLAKFSREHWHDEDEVRFILLGRGLFHVHPPLGPLTAIEVESGDLIRVPRGMWHWFDLCGDRTIRAIRLFQDQSGWKPHYTNSGIDRGYQPVCLGPSYVPSRPTKELTTMKKDQVDLENAVVWISDSKTPNGVAEVPLTELAVAAFRDQIHFAGSGPYLFPSDANPAGHQITLKTVWAATLRRAKIPYFRIYDLRSTYATRLSAGDVADEWVTQLLRQGDAKVFKKYSQMKLQMKREALQKLHRQANESRVVLVQAV